MTFNSVYFATLAEPLLNDAWLKKLHALPKSIVDHCLKFHQPEDQKRRFLGYSLLKNYLIHHGFDQNELSQISYHKNKKPFFTNLPQIHFNLSYSKDLVVCAISDQPIGIDIEKINQDINLDNYKSVFSENMWKKIISSPTPIETFYQYWTQMEAVMKADGLGITGPIQQIVYDKTKITFNNIEREMTRLSIQEGYMAHVVGTNLANIKTEKVEISK